MFKDSTKKSRLGQCKIFTDNMGKNHHRFFFSFLGSTVSNSVLIEHDEGNETCKARMAFGRLVGSAGHRSIRRPSLDSKLFLLQYLCQSFFLYFFSPAIPRPGLATGIDAGPVAIHPNHSELTQVCNAPSLSVMKSRLFPR